MRKSNVRTSLIMLCMAFLMMFFVTMPVQAATTKVEVDKKTYIEVNKATLNLKMGEKYFALDNIKKHAERNNVNNSIVLWKSCNNIATNNHNRVTENDYTYASSDKTIATISKRGYITPKKTGTVKITVTSKTIAYKCKEPLSITFKVKVTKKAKSPKITLKEKKKTIKQGEYYRIKVKKITGISNSKREVFAPALFNTDYGTIFDVTYKSSNTKVATVNAEGTIFGNKPGTTTITVTSRTNKKVKAKFKVTVKKAKVLAEYIAFQGPYDPKAKKAKASELYNTEESFDIPCNAKTFDLGKCVKVYPTNTTNKKVIFSLENSSDSVYATITKDGKMKIKKPTNGSIDIRVKTADGSTHLGTDRIISVRIDDRSIMTWRKAFSTYKKTCKMKDPFSSYYFYMTKDEVKDLAAYAKKKGYVEEANNLLKNKPNMWTGYYYAWVRYKEPGLDNPACVEITGIPMIIYD